MKDLERVIGSAFKNMKPAVSHINLQYGVVDWMKDHIHTPEHHTVPHSFKFETVSGAVMMSYRLWSAEKEWIEAGPIVDSGLLNSPGPLLKKPTFEKLDVDLLRSKLNNENTRRVQDQKTREEWEMFVKKLEHKVEFWERYENDKPRDDWTLLKLKRENGASKKVTCQKSMEQTEVLEQMQMKEVKITKKVSLNYFSQLETYILSFLRLIFVTLIRIFA